MDIEVKITGKGSKEKKEWKGMNEAQRTLVLVHALFSQHTKRERISLGMAILKTGIEEQANLEKRLDLLTVFIDTCTDSWRKEIEENDEE